MLVDSDIATPDRYGFYGGEVKLGEDADNLAIDLVDADGNVLKTFDLGQKAEGETATFYWDGKDAEGNAIDSQALQVVVRGAETSSVSTWAAIAGVQSPADSRSEEHTSELQSLMRISYAVFSLKKKKKTDDTHTEQRAN